MWKLITSIKQFCLYASEMWKLVCERNPSLVHYLSVGKEYNIGRRDCEILIPEDMSISRKHAVIKIIHPDGNLAFPERKSVIHFKDISKLGTQLKDGRISNGEERTLNDGDLLIFGTAGISRYHAIYDPLVVTTSCLMQTSKKEVRRNVLKLGGHLVSEWCRECQLVVMSNLSVTIKVICALVSLKPIVTPQYLEDLVKAVEGSMKLPNTGDYLPSLSESQVSSADVSFNPDARRQTLFSGKTFVFLSPSQFKKLHLGLELGGAQTKLVTDVDNVEALVAADGVCVMNPDAAGSQAAVSWIQSIQSVLTRVKRRMIAESEIGYAVLYCSTATQCNPSIELVGPASGLPAQSLSQNPLQSASEMSGCAISQSQSAIKRTPVAASLNQSSTFRTPLPPVQIKEEPLSQPLADQQNTRNTKKRAREETDLRDSASGAFATLPQESAPSKKFHAATNKEIFESSDRIRQAATSLSAVDKITVSKVRTPVGQGKQLNPDSTTAAVSESKDNLNLSKNLMRYAVVPEETSESLDMQFSIGSCAESSSRAAEVKMEIDSSLMDGAFEPITRKADVGVSGAENKKAFSKQEDCKMSASLLLQENESTKENVKVQPGFLTAALPIRMPVDPEFIKVEELNIKLVVIEVKGLVARQPGRQRSRQTASEAVIVWKGRPIKNFKKFKKVHSLSSGGLPRIIGGKDLVVHESKPTAERDDWFKSDPEAESQRNDSEAISQELNSFQPLARKR